MRALEFITGHVIYNPAYTYKCQLKTTKGLSYIYSQPMQYRWAYLLIGGYFLSHSSYYMKGNDEKISMTWEKYGLPCLQFWNLNMTTK